jgi:uncharacterized membrane protein YbhN (UPF0104 family)
MESIDKPPQTAADRTRETSIGRTPDPETPDECSAAVPSLEAGEVSTLRTMLRALAAGFAAIVLAASAWYIWRTFQWRDLGQMLGHVNLTCLLAGGGLSIAAFWMLRTLRWYILLRRTDTRVPLLDLYLCTAAALGFTLLTPLQSGEMLKVELLKKRGLIQRSLGYGSFLVERALDFGALLAMACASLLTIDILPDRRYVFALWGGFVLVCVTGGIVLTRLELIGWPRRLREHMRLCVGDLPTLALAAAITCVSWASVAFSWQIFLYSAGIAIGFTKGVALMSIVSAIGILSLIPGGVGVSEIGASQLLMHFGFPAATAQAGALVLRSLSVVAIAMGICHFALWKHLRSWQFWRRAPTASTVEILTVDESPSIGETLGGKEP